MPSLYPRPFQKGKRDMFTPSDLPGSGFGLSVPERRSIAAQLIGGIDLPPSSNTGGKSSEEAIHRVLRISKEKVNIDWLALSIPDSGLTAPAGFLKSAKGVQVQAAWLTWCSHVISQWFGGNELSFVAKGHGWLGFEQVADISIQVDGQPVSVGKLAWGGKSQNERTYLSFNAHGCSLIQNYAYIRSWCEKVGARITRVDLAVDFLEGEYNVLDAVADYQEGGFSNGGRQPSHRLQGDWLDPDAPLGRTLYIGKRENGKQLRVYEKGKQLGDRISPWTRAEIEILSKDRVIPLDVLTDPAPYWSGSYSCFADLVDFAAEKIKTVVKEAAVSLDHLVKHARRSYGKLFDVLLAREGGDYWEAFRILRVLGVPRRLDQDLSSLAAPA